MPAASDDVTAPVTIQSGAIAVAPQSQRNCRQPAVITPRSADVATAAAARTAAAPQAAVSLIIGEPPVVSHRAKSHGHGHAQGHGHSNHAHKGVKKRQRHMDSVASSEAASLASKLGKASLSEHRRVGVNGDDGTYGVDGNDGNDTPRKAHRSASPLDDAAANSAVGGVAGVERGEAKEESKADDSNPEMVDGVHCLLGMLATVASSSVGSAPSIKTEASAQSPLSMTATPSASDSTPHVRLLTTRRCYRCESTSSVKWFRSQTRAHE